MLVKVAYLLFALMIGATIVAQADLNSGTEDADVPLNDIISHKDRNSSPADAKGKPRATQSSLSVGILKRADHCPRQAQKGDSLHMHYKGTLASNGKEFDSSYSRGQPFVFTLGTGQVIKGWDQGLTGICAGEKRKLVIPAHLAYGERGSPPTIPPHATLVFEVEAVKVVPPSAARQEL